MESVLLQFYMCTEDVRQVLEHKVPFLVHCSCLNWCLCFGEARYKTRSPQLGGKCNLHCDLDENPVPAVKVPSTKAVEAALLGDQ